MPGDTSQYIDYSKVSKSISETAKRKKDAKIAEYLLNPNKCVLCNNDIPYEKRKSKHCGLSCSNKNRRHSEATKQLIRSSVNTFIKENPDQFYKCMENRENIVVQHQMFSSKNERELLKIIKTEFPSYNFTSGGNFKLEDNSRKSLDIYSKDFKIIIEYDGIYHFKDIYGNFEKVKHKDRLIEKWCIDNNWKIIRVNEKTYHLHKEKVINTIFDMIKNLDQIQSINLLYWEKEV